MTPKQRAENYMRLKKGYEKNKHWFEENNQDKLLADDFAIKFGEWLINDAFAYNTYLYTIQDIKELLEMYKKNKQL